ncbi:Toll-like receptor 4 [Eumeta japonica]|uniref:Toll-like receptor 4 n=1 Tax=Eumeta variegata TaxID=151549 RepID=A0A4C1UMJ1_EUMVA|nr:Toll-like receptor 4 [Eumeta japonica]
MSGRKYKSGAEKRKLQLDREKEKNKCAKIGTFFKSKHKNEDEIAENSSTSDKGGIESEENLFEGSSKSQHQETKTNDENLQSLDYQQVQQPSDQTENDIGVPRQSGNTETERNLQNINFEFEKYVDVALWPELLKTNGLLLSNCRGQSYDNAANMAGHYNGVQALLKQKNNTADYVPCAAHSLNLITKMPLSRYIWLLLCYAQYARSNLVADYQYIENPNHYSRDLVLPTSVPVAPPSRCMCRGDDRIHIIVCFGGFNCDKFPIVLEKCEILRVRTTTIAHIQKGVEIDRLYYLKALEIEANHELKYIEPGAFRNLSNLEQLSISYSTSLQNIDENLFDGLTKLTNLTMVNNGFVNILDVTKALVPNKLPSLERLDLSENLFVTIPENTFSVMTGTPLKVLKLSLCQIDYVHPKSFLPLKGLQEMHISKNELNTTIIGDFLTELIEANINLLYLDISKMGFQRHPPRDLLDVIAKTTIKKLILAENQFEVIKDDAFPKMVNIELLDLRRVLAVIIGPNAFEPERFPNLKALLLGGNNIAGLHSNHLSTQLRLLDLSHNSDSLENVIYFEISKDTFLRSGELQVLNLEYNRIKSIYTYTFRGLNKLKLLSMRNGTLFFIEPGTFRSTPRLEMLDLANNPLAINQNLTKDQFEGLSEMRLLILNNCAIKHLYDTDNMFEAMPNITHLFLKNNQLIYITEKLLKPLKHLKVLDLSGNLMISWWKPLFVTSGIKVQKLYVMNNKISHFTTSMLRDMDYLLQNSSHVVINFDDNIFECDCNAVYPAYMWLKINSSKILEEYFKVSSFQCSSPDIWEDRRVAEYMSSFKSLQCAMYQKISSLVVLSWTAPSLIVIAVIFTISILMYRYRIYVRYWIFLAKLAMGRRNKKGVKPGKYRYVNEAYKYDAFVSYCNDDREFVSEMITQLECNPPYLKLCVYERDFEIGSFISEAILSSVNESKFIVLIVSNHFARSHWCRWETQVAEYHRLILEDGSSYDPLVLVRIGEVDSKYICL